MPIDEERELRLSASRLPSITAGPEMTSIAECEALAADLKRHVGSIEADPVYTNSPMSTVMRRAAMILRQRAVSDGRLDAAGAREATELSYKLRGHAAQVNMDPAHDGSSAPRAMRRAAKALMALAEAAVFVTGKSESA